jgi:gamma-glutamyl:cysteine ligase YbdK (ATP-grasp superfamily)
VGLAIDRDRFEEDDYLRFAGCLRGDLAVLRELLARPGFGEGPTTIGAEVELSLVDEASRPLPRNLEVLAAAGDPRLTVELDRFNLECNSRPVPLAGRPFSALGSELESALGAITRAARAFDGHPVLVGILPTLRPSDLAREAMTDLPRFRALSAGIRRLREAPFALHIDGEDPLEATCDDVTYEGANTSLQVHLRVEPRAFAASHGAAQIATAVALAAAGNSPLFLGHRLWEETRIALFKQAVDERGELPDSWHPPARVGFGHGWVREGAHELFAESVALHPPLLPVATQEDPLACVRAGGIPALEALRLHHGTVWRWNRAIYDPADGGHLRIEMRALAAGPTIADMLANAAFLIGLTLALRDEIDWMLPALPFEHAHRNFYRAAQQGLDALLLWPSCDAPSPRPVRAAELVAQLLPAARRGLVGAGVEEAEAERTLAVVAARAAGGQTGARWQRSVLAHLERGMSRGEALAALVSRYRSEAATGRPVHEWSTAL